ncbi:MAG: thioredoxin-disulfide reductase [Candidatus Merdousia sp.]|nr:thioredoxin-disulfide reductase [Candidatus Merdousia sp.]
MEEIIIIGSGCAGMGAAIYAARAGAKPLVLEGSRPGGLLTTTSEVENYPAFPEGVGGFDLVWKMREQAQKFGARTENATVVKVDFSGDVKKLYGVDGKVFEAKKVIIATGASPRMTGAKGEAELLGTGGVSVCATCDGAFYKGKDVAVIGGGDTACEEALFLSRFCSSVKIVHRRDSFRASRVMSDRVAANPKISVVWNSVLEEVLKNENGKCRGISVKNTADGSVSEIPCAGVFIAIGYVPDTKAFVNAVDTDKDGYIIPYGKTLVQTSVADVYAAGDCTDRVFGQAITATAMGCMAAILASS